MFSYHQLSNCDIRYNEVVILKVRPGIVNSETDSVAAF